MSNRLTLLLLVWMAVARAMASGADQVIVLDVSNSMWGQVEGRAKIDIARQVIGDLVAEWPASRRIGLVAYGHRRAGDCTDIEPLIPVGPIDKAHFTAIVNRLQPQGKTPLAEAVRQAAEILGYKDRPATVILVSDGLESCNADPCALAESLEIGGVDFTAHVIGFDISSVQDQRQLGCLAGATGGRFLTAANAQELEDALEAASGLRQPAPVSLNVPEAQLKVPKQVRIGAAFPVQWAGPDQSGDYLSIARPGDLIGRYYKHARTTDGNPATLRAPDYPGIYQVRYVHGPTHRITGRAQLPVVDVAAELGAPAEAGVGRSVRVDWTGPGNRKDFITVVPLGAPERKLGHYVYARDGSQVKLLMPDHPGDYEIRYLTGKERQVLARRPIRVDEVKATLVAPISVAIGSRFEVVWSGPDGRKDYIAINETGSPDKQYKGYAYTRHGSPLRMHAPNVSGDYELRYVTGQTRRVLARRSLVVSGTAE